MRGEYQRFQLSPAAMAHVSGGSREGLEHFNLEMFRWLREQTPAVEA